MVIIEQSPFEVIIQILQPQHALLHATGQIHDQLVIRPDAEMRQGVVHLHLLALARRPLDADLPVQTRAEVVLYGAVVGTGQSWKGNPE